MSTTYVLEPQRFLSGTTSLTAAVREIARSAVDDFLAAGLCALRLDATQARILASLDTWQATEADMNLEGAFMFANVAETMKKVVRCARRTVGAADDADDANVLTERTLNCLYGTAGTDSDSDSDTDDDDVVGDDINAEKWAVGAIENDGGRPVRVAAASLQLQRPEIKHIMTCILRRRAAKPPIDPLNPVSMRYRDDVDAWCEFNKESLVEQLHEWAAANPSADEKAWALLKIDAVVNGRWKVVDDD